MFAINLGKSHMILVPKATHVPWGLHCIFAPAVVKYITSAEAVCMCVFGNNGGRWRLLRLLCLTVLWGNAPGSRRTSNCQTSWHTSARQTGSTRRRSRKSSCRWRAASTPPCLCSWGWLSWPRSPRSCHPHWNTICKHTKFSQFSPQLVKIILKYKI